MEKVTAKEIPTLAVRLDFALIAETARTLPEKGLAARLDAQTAGNQIVRPGSRTVENLAVMVYNPAARPGLNMVEDLAVTVRNPAAMTANPAVTVYNRVAMVVGNSAEKERGPDQAHN